MEHLIQVYPCVYREHCCISIYFVFIAGLSLCIQGTLLDLDEFANDERFIPVYTGNTKRCIAHHHKGAVYPCVYREHMFNNKIVQPFRWFIPVYTGNTYRNTSPHRIRAVYPCVYREHPLL